METTISNRIKALTGLACLHAMIVVLGAANIRTSQLGGIGELVTWYGALTGAERGFGFFAPRVNTMGRPTFEVTEKSGKVLSVDLSGSMSEEAALRLYNFGSRFWQVLDKGDENMRHAMAASLAGKVFGRYPEASSVKVNFELYELVSMTEYRSGKRPRWNRIYEARFEKQPGMP